jgi:hypothetical protein
MFCEGVQHRLRFCLDHLNCVEMAAFQFHLQSGKQKSRVGGWDEINIVFVKNFLLEEEVWDCALL